MTVPTSDEFEMIRVRIERNSRGLYYATSSDIKGLHLAHRDLNAILADVPNVIRLWFKRTHKIDVRVFHEAVEHEGVFDVNAFAMPPHVEEAELHA